MVRLTVYLLSLLAVGTTVMAIPTTKPALIAATPLSKTTVKPTTTAAKPTKTSSVAGVPTGKITIPDFAIDTAPIVNIQPVNNSVVTIQSVAHDNSTLVNARPDLQVHVDIAGNITNSTTPKVKRDLDFSPLAKRVASGFDCQSSTVSSVTLDQPTWNKLAIKVCKQWYPDPNSFFWVPSAPLPTSSKSSTIGPINVGGGLIVTMKFTFGVDDWGTQLGGGWQQFYVPQTQSLCIADLQTLINDMNDVCLNTNGYSTAGDFTGSEQPKWYTFGLI